MNEVLRRVLEVVRPEYLSWSVEERERYHVTKSRSDHFEIDRRLVEILFDIRACNVEERLDVPLTDEQALLLNSTILPILGIGEDRFAFSEGRAPTSEKSILDLETVYDHGLDSFLCEVKVRRTDPYEADQEFGPYRGELSPDAAWLEIDGRFHYAWLSGLAEHLRHVVEEVGDQKIAELIPHRLVPGPNHGEETGDGFLWDYRNEADGLEEQLEELNHRFIQYLNGLTGAYLERLDRETPGRVYLIDSSSEPQPQKEILFTDRTATRAVRFRHFVEDCRRIAGDPETLDALEEAEVLKAVRLIEREFRDILENCDPGVQGSRKKPRIIVRDEGLL